MPGPSWNDFLKAVFGPKWNVAQGAREIASQRDFEGVNLGINRSRLQATPEDRRRYVGEGGFGPTLTPDPVHYGGGERALVGTRDEKIAAQRSLRDYAVLDENEMTEDERRRWERYRQGYGDIPDVRPFGWEDVDVNR